MFLLQVFHKVKVNETFLLQLTVTFNGFDLFQLMVISVTVNLNHTAMMTTDQLQAPVCAHYFDFDCCVYSLLVNSHAVVMHAVCAILAFKSLHVPSYILYYCARVILSYFIVSVCVVLFLPFLHHAFVQNKLLLTTDQL